VWGRHVGPAAIEFSTSQETIVAETQDILAAAVRLGALVATHPTVLSYKETIRQLDLDVGAKTLLQQ
jgi:hypothetical protein